MIIVPVNNKSIEQALKKYKEKYVRLKISKQLNEKKEYEKPTTARRRVRNKARHTEKKRNESEK